MNTQQLHTVPNRTWVIVQEGAKVPPSAPQVGKGDRIFFDHIDGMYSFCRKPGVDIPVHIAAWTEVTICEDQD